MLAPWPVAIPPDWLDQVQQPQTGPELAALRRSRDRGVPFGDAPWVARTAKALDLESTLRPVGRPKKPDDGKGAR